MNKLQRFTVLSVLTILLLLLIVSFIISPISTGNSVQAYPGPVPTPQIGECGAYPGPEGCYYLPYLINRCDEEENSDCNE